MDFYQNVVVDYLRADRSVFVNTECCIQLNQSHNPDKSGPHWYCDAVAVDFQRSEVFLCEVSYADQLAALKKRLEDWNHHWSGVIEALERDSHIPQGWQVRVWLFVPAKLIPKLVSILKKFDNVDGPFQWKARITPLERVQPWLYSSWDHQDCNTAKEEVPAEYQG